MLLIGLVMLGVAVKGFFMFLQEVLVADVMQLTLFDIRNLFFRRTINLDLASFSDQGSVGADGPVHQRHGLVRPGAQHAHEQGDPRADADRDLPGGSALDQLAADLPDPDLGPDLRRDDVSASARS